ncbi:hypothetical protein [uncultured Methylobacterium sp.]|uniref:hypothetical protein n=1 Tax=uncultured Methylobacterium sp. TaxID=157278 RepID=UPI0035CA72A9
MIAMADGTNDLIDAVMKTVQARSGNIAKGLREVRGKVRASGTTIHDVREDLHALETHVERIARRLDIIDVPAF